MQLLIVCSLVLIFIALCKGERGFKVTPFQQNALPQLALMVAAERLQIAHDAQHIMLSSPVFVDVFACELSRLERRLLESALATQSQKGFANDRRAFMAVAKHDPDLLVGFVDSVRRDPQHSQLQGVYVSELIVREGWRRQGVARALLHAVEAVALNEWHEQKQFLRVEIDNMKAIALYRSCGFMPDAAETYKLASVRAASGVEVPPIPTAYHKIIPYDKLEAIARGAHCDFCCASEDESNIEAANEKSEDAGVESLLKLFTVLQMVKQHRPFNVTPVS